MLDIPYMDIQGDQGDKIAKNLSNLIDERGTNERALANAAGLNPTGVRDIIKRKVKNPRHDTLVKIASALGVPVTDITGDAASDPGLDEAMNLLWKQLLPEERQFLKSVAEARIAERQVAAKPTR